MTQNLLSTVVGQIKNSSMTYGFLMYKPEDGKSWYGKKKPHQAQQRWSHGAVVINAIPDPQLYIWGGLTGALTTGKKPSGTYMNDMRLYNLNNQSWQELPFQKKLRGRCDTPLAYRRNSGNFYVFGGWSNKWYNDLWKADMNSIIGPHTILQVLSQLMVASRVVRKSH